MTGLQLVSGTIMATALFTIKKQVNSLPDFKANQSLFWTHLLAVIADCILITACQVLIFRNFRHPSLINEEI